MTKKWKHEPPPRVIVDTREQAPWRFGWAAPLLREDGSEPDRVHLHDGIVDRRSLVTQLLDGPFEARVGTLETGDYALDVPEPFIAIERKSANDLVGTVTVGRERFERELERLAAFRHRLVIVEAPIELFLEGRTRSRVTPQSLIGSLFALSTRCNIPFWCLPSREQAEYAAAWALRDAWRRYLAEQAEAATKALSALPAEVA